MQTWYFAKGREEPYEVSLTYGSVRAWRGSSARRLDRYWKRHKLKEKKAGKWNGVSEVRK